MLILGLEKLETYSRKHADCRKALLRWIDVVSSADWQTPQDIKNEYRSADFLSGNRVIFNIRGNNYRLLVRVIYNPNGFVRVEWVGTHAEYDKQKF